MIRPFTCVCLLLAGGSGLYLYQSKHRVQMLDHEIEAIVHQTEAARARTGVLRAEWTLMNDPERLGQLAERFLPLKTTTPGQFTTMADLDNRLPAVRPPEPPHDGGPRDATTDDEDAATAGPPAGLVEAAKPEAPKPDAAKLAAAPHPAPAPVVAKAAAPKPRPVQVAAQAPAPAAPVVPPYAVSSLGRPAAYAPPAYAPPAYPPPAFAPPAPSAPRVTQVSAPAAPPPPMVGSSLGMARTMVAPPYSTNP